MKIVLVALYLLLALQAPANAEDFFENDGDALYRIYDENGAYLTARAGRVFPGDEYIAANDRLYRVESVDEQAATARARYLGDEPPASRDAFAAYAEAGAKKLVCMYSTHSDESYHEGDGAASKTEGAGIYDVGDAFKEHLESHGVEVEYSDETFLPHDAGAYRRSSSTAKQLAQKAPAALFDLHRDGIPDASEYEHEVDGEETSKVRLEVGRSNANAQANRAFAKQIKETADDLYPGLIKDIYVGKGNYNQELYPKALLLEFGTHTLDKELAVKSTEYMADVVNEVLFGGTAKAATKAENKGAGKGIAWAVGLAVLAAIVYALAATGTFRGMGNRLGRGVSEITGGLFGKKPKDRE